jgi:FkbM family methyltransferase
LDQFVPNEGIFLDCGANGGYFSIYLAIRPNFHGRIHAFEPIARTFAFLRGLVDSLQCDNVVTCHQLAVSDVNGTAKMEVGADLGRARIHDESVEQDETVRTISLDFLNLDRVDFIKLDVESHEIQALKGADALIKSHNPFIFLESTTCPTQPDKVFEPLQFLVDRGYLLYLPTWLQSDGTFFVGIGPGYERETFALVPFTFKDRLTFPGDAINIFACPRSREVSLGEPYPSAR